MFFYAKPFYDDGMSGHSKWAQIKRQKEVVDKKRGQVFTKLSKAITQAVRQGGSDPSANPTLRLAIDRALAANMTKENINRAIDRIVKAQATGQTITLEAYAPYSVALLITVVTDNRNRTVAEIRGILSKHAASLAESGSVAWQFERQGEIVIKAPSTMDEIELSAIDAGALDSQRQGDTLTIITPPDRLQGVQERIRAQGGTILTEHLVTQTKQPVQLTPPQQAKIMSLITQLENYPDVINVSTNSLVKP